MRLFSKLLLLVFLMLSLVKQVHAQSFNGTVTAGYSSIYNYELDAAKELRGRLFRTDITAIYNKFLFETDYQHIIFDKGNSFFLHNSLGYRLYSGMLMPDTYLLANHVYSSEFPMEGIIYNKKHTGVGCGFMFRMKIETLLNGDASFAITYFPSKKIMYKNMQIGWDLRVIGISFGGIGIRVPDGRLYSGFVFSIRYKW